MLRPLPRKRSTPRAVCSGANSRIVSWFGLLGATMRPETLTETIYERMRGDLPTGVFAPGVPMRLEDVRQRYNVSTSPLREAMFRLTAEGFLLLSSQRGFRVAPLSHGDLLDLTERRTGT